MTEFPQLDSGLAVYVFTQGDDLIACLNKAMDFLSAVAASRFPLTNDQHETSFNPRNQATIQDEEIMQQDKQGLLNAIIVKTKDLDAYDCDYDDVSNAKAVLMANLSNYGSDVISEDKSCDNQNVLEILEYFENNDLKAQLQAKDTTIRKLKEHIKSLRENDKEEKVKQDMDEIETINIELEHKYYDSLIAQLNSESIENVDLKGQIQEKTRALSKEYYDSLIAQLNSESIENADLKGQIQEKVFVTTILQNELRRLKGKNVLDNATTITNATTISPGMFKLDLDPLAPMLLKNKDAHIDYLKYTQEQVVILRGIVKQAKAKQPLDNALDFACMFDANHDVCFFDFVNDVNVRSKSKSAKNNNKKNIWKSTGKVFTKIGYRLKPIGRTFTLVGCPDCSLVSRFRNDQIAKIIDYGDYQLGNVTISRVYYVDGLKHNLLSVGQFYDLNLEVAFQKTLALFGI
nr:integrase, catalytic region, zinc finger, CCHC-type, peptidase aspartic, catalytic [Tanacetum cinerariifolium]